MVKVFIIGCGKIGNKYVDALKELGINIAGVSDIEFERAKELAASCGAEPFKDYKQILSKYKSKGDIACITTPPWCRRDIAVAFAQGNFHIFCEKPLSNSLKSAREIIETADSLGIRVGMGFKMRYESIFAQAKMDLKKLDLGEVQYVFINYFQPLPNREWYLDMGVTSDLLVHAMDLANWYLVSRPVSIRASFNYNLKRTGEDKAFIEIKYNNDKRAILTGGYLHNYPEVAGTEDIIFELVCSEGYIVGRRPDFLLIRNKSGTIKKHIKPVNAFKQELASFISAIKKNRFPPISGIDGLKTQVMIEGALNSSKKNSAEINLEE